MFGPARKDVSKEMSHNPGPTKCDCDEVSQLCSTKIIKYSRSLYRISDFGIISALAIEHTQKQSGGHVSFRSFLECLQSSATELLISHVRHLSGIDDLNTAIETPQLANSFAYNFICNRLESTYQSA